MIKKIILSLLEPLKALSNRSFAEKAAQFFEKQKWATYVLSFLLTTIILFLVYVLPNL